MSFISINPATGKKTREYRATSPAQIERAVARAHRAFLGWRETAPSHRAHQLRLIAEALRANAAKLANLAAREMGKPLADGKAEVEKCALGCEFYARHGGKWLRDERPDGASAAASVAFEPLGVVLAIMPWNFPFWQVFRAAAPALMAGNTLLLKHASNVCDCAVAIEQVFRDAGVPPGLFQTLLITSREIPALINDSRICGVTLTGSTAAGKKVASLAGAALKPSVLELGGSDAYVVLADADLDQAAEICATARLMNAGQSCICAKRFIVVQSVVRAFETKLAARMQARVVGDPFDPKTNVGPLARADLRQDLQRQVDASIRRGAKLLLGGKIPPAPGFYYPPTILTNVRPGMPAYADELFGPVAAIIAVADENEAVIAANDSIYGLGAAIFSRNRRKARELATRLEAGNVFINDFVRSDPALPFGGIKQSGFGRELGIWGLRSFVNVKTISIK